MCQPYMTLFFKLFSLLFRCQQIQFQIANVLADMAEMKLEEKEQQEDAVQASALPRGMQLFMRAKAAMAKKSAWCKTFPVVYWYTSYFLLKAHTKHDFVHMDWCYNQV